MTKVDAIKKVLEDNGGVAVWSLIYSQIEQYYPEIKRQQDWKAGIRGVLYRDIGKNFKILDEKIIALLDYNEENLILDTEIGDTSKSTEVKIRIGQNRFRKELLRHLKKCPITGIDTKELLLASHIKPWALSTNQQRLDIYNGFIFSPTIDKLFDRHLITFEDNKKMIISPKLSVKNIAIIGIENGKKYEKLPIEGRTAYLEIHRQTFDIDNNLLTE